MAKPSVMSKTDLVTLIGQCQGNNRKAQEELYNYYYYKMRWIVYRILGKDDTNIIEVINNGFIKAFMNIDKFSFKGAFESWLTTIMQRACYDYLKHHKQKNIVPLGFDDSSTEENYSNRFLIEEIKGLLDTFPANMQQVVLMTSEGYDHRSIGEVLNIPEGTSKWLLNQARIKLRDKINPELLSSFTC